MSEEETLETARRALAESRERLAHEAQEGGAGYRQVAAAWRRGEIEAQVRERLAARGGLGPDGSLPEARPRKRRERNA